MIFAEHVVGFLSGTYRSDPFRERAPQRPVTMGDLETSAGWILLAAERELPAAANALSIGGLRFSRLFPQMFLQRTAGRVPAVLTLTEAAEWVQTAAREFPERPLAG